MQRFQIILADLIEFVVKKISVNTIPFRDEYKADEGP
jgi:hypothetical protein